MKLLLVIDELLGLLTAALPLSNKHTFVGLDGYVDRIQKVVRAQQGSESAYFDTLPDLAARIQQAAGKSAQLELVNQTVKAGGNAPIMAHALGTLGLPNYCLGNFGEDTIHPVFKTMSDNCQLLSLGKPAETNALEFDDGKLILSELSTFSRLDWAFVQQKFSVRQLIDRMNKCEMIALVDWCNLPLATDVWQGILKDVLPGLDDTHQRQFFFDLADPSKKSEAEILQVLEVISEYSAYGEVTLGLNENEAHRLAQVLFSREGKNLSPGMALEEISQFIFIKMSVSLLLVHPLDSVVVVSREGVQRIRGRLVKKPLISTGGGDNLNAGFCFGRLMGCNPKVAAVLGMATSGAYVQYGQSPHRQDLKNYLEQWRTEIIKNSKP